MKKITIAFTIVICSSFSFGNHTAFEVRTVGQGEPILLFPGFTCTDEVWQDVVKEFSQTNQLHLFTFAGFGAVQPIDTPWFSTIKEQVVDYIEQSKLQSASVIGHSMGGTLALWLSSDRPAWFSKIVVVDALPCLGALMMPNYKSEMMRYDSPYNNQMLNMGDEQYLQNARNMANFMCSDSTKHQQLIEWSLQADRKTYVYGFTDLLKVDLREQIAKIEVPVLVLGATFPVKEQVMANYSKQYSKLTTSEIRYPDQGSRHFIMWDRPEWFLQQVNTFLRN